MINLLLLLSIILVLVSYTRIILLYLKTKNIKLEDMTGFDLAKELTLNYDDINIVESKEINISKYNLKRKIIRLTNKDYNSNNIFTLSKTSLLAGFSLANINKDKNIELLSKILPNIDYLNKTSLIALLLSILTNNIGDAKIAIIILIIILIYQYLINEINNISKEQTTNQLKELTKEKNYLLLEQVQNSFLFLNKISFITTLILILREVLIIIN